MHVYVYTHLYSIWNTHHNYIIYYFKRKLKKKNRESKNEIMEGPKTCLE